MNTSAESIRDWQGWLARFDQAVSATGWRDFMSSALDSQIPLPQWAAVYMIPVQGALANAMLLACLQAPEAEVEATLAGIARRAREARFGKAPRDLEKELRGMYQESTRNLARKLPSTADLFKAVFTCYLRGDYDSAADANLFMRDAQNQSAARHREAALTALGHAGAASLRGSRLWGGWADEGGDEFRHWGLSLNTMLDGFGAVLPLGDVASERSRAGERAASLSPENVTARAAEGVETDLGGGDEGPPEEFVEEWVEIANREQPLTDVEIRQMGERYEQFTQLAIRALEMRDTAPEALLEEDVAGLAATILGMLRCSDEHAVNLLIGVIAHDREWVHPDAIESAIWALQQMGVRAVEAAFDFARYSSLDEPRADVLRVLAVAGRGSVEVYDYLEKQFTTTPWADGRDEYILPLALTHDPRVLPLIIEALRDQTISEDDAWDLLDALQELEVTFFVNHDTRAIDVPGFGVIEDVLPRDWRTRKELAEEEAEAEAAGAEWEEWDDEDDIDDEDEDGEEYEDDVVYDKDGIPRCPDCGAEMHYIAGRWVHPPATPNPPQLQPPRDKPIGRNDPCWCGSGKKFKYCHGRDA